MKHRIAIVGSGIAGMGCAHFLHEKFDVTIFEQENYIGGHTNTIYVEEDESTIPIDTGFIVCNFENYPNLMHLFKNLGVPLKKTSMSFSAWHKEDNIQYGGSNLAHLFAQRKNLVSPKYLRFLLQVKRFNNECIEVLSDDSLQYLTVTEYLQFRNYNKQLLDWYILPMTSALWSSPPDISSQFPILSLVRFFHNHGMLGLNTQYQWFTVDGGSEAYKQKLIRPFKNRIAIKQKVERIELEGEIVKVILHDGTFSNFDKVIIATHADQAASIVRSTNLVERHLLQNFTYQLNKTTLHTDSAVMPSLKKVWGSWNYRVQNSTGELHASTTYWMNSLQNVSNKENYFVTLNDFGTIDPEKIMRHINYYHPVFTTDALRAQGELHSLNANGKVFFCGSYFGNGFHEDAFVSGLKVSEIIAGQKLQEE